MSTQKSAISWGISWRTTAIVVARQTAGEMMKLAAIISPSMKLCIKSQTRFIQAKLWTWWVETGTWQCLRWIYFSTIKWKIIPKSTTPETHNGQPYSSTSSGIIWKNTSPNNAPAAKLTRNGAMWLSFFALIRRTAAQINEIKLTSPTAKSVFNRVIFYYYSGKIFF